MALGCQTSGDDIMKYRFKGYIIPITARKYDSNIYEATHNICICFYMYSLYLMGSTTYTTTSSVSIIISVTTIADFTKLRCFLIMLKVLVYPPVQCRELSTKKLCNSTTAGRHANSLLLLYDINMIVYRCTCMHTCIVLRSVICL